MTALAARTLVNRLREPAALRRGLMAGAAWGISLTVALTLLAARQCGGVCIDDALWLGSVSIATGFVTIGPIATFGRCEA